VEENKLELKKTWLDNKQIYFRQVLTSRAFELHIMLQTWRKGWTESTKDDESRWVSQGQRLSWVNLGLTIQTQGRVESYQVKQPRPKVEPG